MTQPLIDSENANPGDTVSNGRYFALNFTTPSSSSTCDVHRLGYIVQAIDFAGNVSTATGSVTYRVPEAELPGFGGGIGIVGGTAGDNCDEEEGTTCSVRPEGCQFGFEVQGTWQCVKGNDKCIPPPEGGAGSYCSGPWTNTPNLCGRGLASVLQYGSACTLAGVNSRCKPGTRCISGLDPLHGAGCGVVPACGTLPTCWHVNDNVNICSADDWR